MEIKPSAGSGIRRDAPLSENERRLIKENTVIDEKVALGKTLSRRKSNCLAVIRTLYE